MGWRDNLRPASFRGIPFEVTGADQSGGRRSVTHEYPQKDKPFSEDMGRKAREFSITAFVIGDDYMVKRDALFQALEAEGPGELVHPYRGTMQVVVPSFRMSERFEEGRMASFDITFGEDGDLAFPMASVSTGDQVSTSVAKVMGQLSSAFSRHYSKDNIPDWAARQMGDDAVGVLTAVRSVISQADTSGSWLSQFDEKTSGVDVQTASASMLGAAVTSGLTKPETDQTGSNLGQISRWAASGDAALAAPSATTATDPVSQQLTRGKATMRALARGCLLAQGAAAMAQTDVTVYQDAMAARQTMTEAMDAEMLNALSDDDYQAWADLRAKLYADLTQRARGAARLKDLTLPQTTPSVVVAYDLYEDAARDSEIVARNAIRHPGFIPPEPVKVLSQ